MELSIRGAREERPDSTARAAAEVLDWAQRIRAALPKGAKWTVIDRSFQRVPALEAGALDKVLRTSPPVRKSERESRRTTYDATLVCAVGKTDLVRLQIGFSSAEDAAKAPFFVALTLSGELVASWPVPVEPARSFFEDTVRAFRLRGATCSPRGALRADPSLPGLRAGWLTFLPSSLGPLPDILVPTEVFPLDDLGWTIVAQHDVVDLANPEHAASIAYVRHALGARVLLDGPSFPPPSAAPAPEPARAPLAPPPESQVPSYLKAPHAAPAPPAVAPIAVVPAVAAPAVAPPTAAAQGKTPLTTGTADVDLSKLLGASLPFNPHAQKSSPADTQPSAHAQKSSLADTPPGPHAEKPGPADTAHASALAASGGFGETESFDLGALLKRGPAVPFAQAHPAPQPSPATPAEPRGHGRWVRFNPQTGEPLAVPRWEPLPEPPKK